MSEYEPIKLEKLLILFTVLIMPLALPNAQWRTVHWLVFLYWPDPQIKPGPSILPAHWQALHGFKTDVPRIIQPVLHLFLLSLLPPSAFLTQVCNESVADDVLTRAQLVHVSIGVICIEYSSTHNPYISPCYSVPRAREKRRTNQLLGASCSASCHVPCFLL